MRLSLIALFGFVSLLSAAEPDWKQPQSPAKPAPTGLKYIDQGTNDPRLKGYQTPEGFKLEIVADEPTIINPVGMTFGPDGTLFVLEWTPESGPSKEFSETVTYKDGTKRESATMKKASKDFVKKLSYDPVTGKFNSAKVILEDELPSSILIHDGWLYTTGRGTVRRWKLADIIDGTNKNAAPQVIAKGFCGFHHHQVSGLTIGIDGLLYITSGDDDNIVEGSDGSRATVLRTGAVFRCRPDGSKMEVFSLGYRNPYRDLAFDRKFNAFHVDNDNEDGSKFTGCRLMHVAEESDFGWRLREGARCCQPDPVRGSVAGELPGKLPPMLKTGRGAPAGLLIYNDMGLPEYFRGLLLYPDVFRKNVRAYRVAPVESTFEVTQEFEFLKSDDPLFRPCQMVTGPDGAIYVCDWRTDSGGAGRLSGDGRHGRIYRLTWAGGVLPDTGEDIPAIARRGMDSWAKIVAAPDAELLKSLAAESMTDRQIARMELVRRGEKNRAGVLEAFNDGNLGFDARSAALGVLESMWNADVRKAVLEVFDETDGDLKRLAIEALARHAQATDTDLAHVLIKMLGDHDRSLRRAAALALGKLNPPNIAEDLVISLRTDKGIDPFLTDGYLRAIERLGKPGITALLDLARSGNQGYRERCVTAMQACRSPEAFAALPELLLDPHLSADQRAELIASATNYQFNPPVKTDALLAAIGKIAQPSAGELSAIVTTLAEMNSLSGETSLTLTQAALESDKPETRLAAIAAIEKSRSGELAPVLLRALDDKSRDVSERIAILKALRNLNKPGLGDAVKALFKSNPPALLRAEAMRTLAAIDPAAVAPLATESLESADAKLQAEAVQLLGATPEGAKLIGQRFLDKKLPRELLPQVSDALRKHSAKDPAIGKLLTDVMRGGLLVSLEPAQVEKVRQLVLTRGDAGRGRALYLNSQSLACVTCHKLEGVGGQVGPDLTRLWDTASIEKIIESMVDPSKEIKEGYQSYRLVTTKGRTHTGLKITETKDEVTLREATGAEVRVPRAEVEELAPSKTSLMPDNVVSQLSFDQFVDLVAFLKNRQTQESLRGIVTEYAVRGPIPPGAASADILKMEPRKLSAQPNGVLNLRTAFPKGEVKALVEVHVRSPKEQNAQLIYGTDGTARVSLNGRLVGELETPRPFNRENDRLPVMLQEGWNTIWLEVAAPKDDFRVALRIQGSDLKIAAMKE
ncbi:PVC-type heme-binding CxxCH protein [Zavarzinella formosa]|uniref:PVC-type heme-binding CxxCH protein n=1 Tax=Zavarzinella formosa TaxID=360055 RepID=UPI0002DA7CA7|nr:PVC-type heme-binding CxxCH protein [Zavarzinella formosa]